MNDPATDLWKNELSGLLNNYLNPSMIDGYHVTYVNSSPIYLPTYRTGPFNIIIAIDLNSKGVLDQGTKILSAIYGKMRASNVATVLNVKVLLLKNGKDEIFDQYYYRDFKDLEVESNECNLNRLIDYIRKSSGKPDLVVYITGQKNCSSTLSNSYPLIWVLVENDRQIKVGKGMII